MSLKSQWKRPSWLRRGGGIFLFFLVLVLNRPAAAQNYLLRYANTTSGAITFSGNTLGLNNTAASGSVGAFITTDTNSTAGGGYPNGTTLNWSNNSSSAVLRLPTNSTVLYAELVWAGTCETVSNAAANSGSNVLSQVTNAAVNFVLPNGATNSVAHDPATFSIVTNFNGAAQQALFYVCSANVTALVQATGAGTYTVGGVPAEIFAGDTSDDCAGWTLAVAYQNNSLRQRNLSIFVGNYWINAASAADSPPVGVSGFCSPPTGTVNGYLFVSSMEGDPQTSGDQMEFGTTTNAFSVLSGPNNPANNFFCSQINYCQPDNLFGTAITNGWLDNSGSFGLNNATPGSAVAYARQGWDITCVNVSAGLTNGVTSAFAKFITSGDGYSANALALQIDVGSPVLVTTQTVDKASTFVGDTLTYTVAVTNSGTADAVNLIFTDPLPFGTSFITNTFATNGVVIAAANPVNSVFIPLIKQNSSYVITYQVLVDQIPPSAKFITAATIDFQYAGACAQSPIINGTLVNADVQTLVPLLSVSKAASLTNVIPGAAMTYTINVPNVGTTNTTGATLLDPLPAGVSYVTNTTSLNGISVPDLGGTNMPFTVASEIHGPGRPSGIINVGDTAVVAFQVLISTNPPLRINNTATIFANGLIPTSAFSAAADISPVYSDLAAGITGSPNPVAAGAAINYTVSVTNNGPDSINDITNFITLYLPLSSSIMSPIYTPGSGAYNPLTGVWSGISLASNGVVTLTVSGQVSPDTIAGNIISSVTVTPPVGVTDLVTNNNSAAATNAVVQVADLAVTISDGVTNVHQGDALTYTITAINLGPSTLTSITLSNSLSAFLNNFTYAPSQGNYNPVNGVWSGLNLTPGNSVTLMLQAVVRNNVTGAFTNSVSASVPAGVTDPNLANNAAVDIDDVLATPDVAISKAGPANVFAGTNFTYTFTVTNAGFATASNVVASDVLPTNTVFVSASGNGINSSGTVNWNLGNLAADTASNFTLTVTAPFSGSITNVATVAADTADSNPANNTSPPVVTGVTPVADLAVGKSGPASVTASSNYTYTVSITNLGPSPASGVVVTDTLPAGLSFVGASGGGVNSGGSVHWALGAFVSGQTSNLILTVTAPATGSITNTAKANSATLDTNAVNNTSPQVISTVATLALSADVGVTKTGPANVFAGTNFSYTITVTNSGPSAASNVVASDVLPANVVFVSASGGGTTNAGTVNWNVGNLAVNTASNLTLTVTAPASGTVTNIATATSTTADPTPGNNTSPPVGTTITPLADVIVTGSGPATVLAGGTIIYSVTVTNSGPSTAGNVAVSNSLPPGVAFVSADNGGTNNSGVVTWPVIASLTNGGTFTFTVTVTAPASGILTNVVSGVSPTADPIPGNNNGSSPSAMVITAVTPVADLAAGKSGPAASFLGGNFTYTISVTNFGPSTATALSVTDNLPAGLAFASSLPATTTVAGNQVIWTNLNDLASGAITNLTLNVTATSRATITNFASAGSPVFDPDPANNLSAPAITAITNRPPVAANDSASTPKNIPVTIPVLANDSDPDGDALTIISVSPTNGTANIVGTNVVFTPATNFIGAATAGYTISDGHGGTSSALITISVTNRPPVAVNDGASTPKNIPVTIPVLANDSDPDGDALTIISVSPTNGTANIVGTNVVFTPATNFIGAAMAGYTISDGHGGTSSALITISVTNRPPVAVNDGASTPENVAVAIPVLANDSDPDGDALTIISVSPTNGTANIVGTNVVFTPATNFVGTAFAGYTITDGSGGTNSALVTITVTNNLPPVAVNDAYSTPQGVTLIVPAAGGVLTNDTDAGGNPLTAVLVSNPTHGILVLNTNGGFTYTPTNNFTGTDSFTYRANDGLTNSGVATVTLTIIPAADIAVFKTGPATGGAGSNLIYTITVTNLGPSTATNVLVKDLLPAGFTFVSAVPATATVSNNLVSWPGFNLSKNAKSNLTVTAVSPEGGNFTNLAFSTATTLDPNPTNNDGTATNSQADTIVTARADVAIFKTGATNILAGTGLTYTIIATNFGPSTATNVAVSDQLPTNAVFQSASPAYTLSNGVVTWPSLTLVKDAATNFTVTVTAPAGGNLTNFAFSVAGTTDPNPTNNNGTATNSIVRTSVTPVADIAIGKSGPAAIFENTNFIYNIAVTNFGPSTATALSVTDSLPAGIVFVGSVPAATTNSGKVIWNLGNFAASATTNLTLTVKATARGTVTNFATARSSTLDTSTNNNTSAPVITAITNRLPVAVNDNASTPKNVAVTIPVLANDSDPDGDALTIISVSPTNGTAIISGTNVVFTPQTNFIGTAFAGYTITDGHGGTNTALITISVTNRPPVANNQSVTVAENSSKAITLTGSDPDGDPLTYLIVSSPVNGVLSLLNTNTGAVTYTPGTNYAGADSFTFRVNDGTTNSGLATVSITVASPSPADLAVIKTGPATGVAGSNLVYTITVTNAGPSAATNVLVSDQLPAGFNFVSATPATATVVSNLVSWPAFNLASQGKTNFTVTAVSAEGGNFTNIAFATSDSFDSNPANNNGTATNSQTRTVVTPSADVAVFKSGGTNVLANGTVTYTITATNLGPSTATNVIVKDNLPANTTFQSASPACTLSNGVVTWPSLILAKGDSTNFSVTLIAPANGAFTNIALSTSGTSDPNPTNNNGSSASSTVRTSVTPVADLIVLLFGPTNVSVGDSFTYTITVTNGGPSTAASVLLKDNLPANLTFISASGGGVFLTNVITWPVIAALANGATTNFTFTVSAPVVGQFTNIAFATSSTLDLNLTNNDGTATQSQARTVVASPQFAWLAGTPVFNPQTGLFEESVVVTNIGATTVPGVRLYVAGLRSGVTLYNATSTTNNPPYVEYDSAVDPSNTVTFALEFYDVNRLAFTSTLTAVAVLPPNTSPGGTNGVAIIREFMDTRIPGDTRFVIEFTSVPGKTYTVIYSDNHGATWLAATPSVTANANITQWYDDGPPKTVSKPESVSSRVYRVIQN
jgi:uncharacterized repeat protein (TIGR01451 family)